MAIAGAILSRLIKAAITLLAIAILNFFLVHNNIFISIFFKWKSFNVIKE